MTKPPRIRAGGRSLDRLIQDKVGVTCGDDHGLDDPVILADGNAGNDRDRENTRGICVIRAARESIPGLIPTKSVKTD
jgi:hypothetical protein